MQAMQRQNVQAQQPEKNQPEKKFSTGAISATIWQNEGKTKAGESAVYKTVSLQRSYKDKNGQWKTTASFRVSDLPKASVVLSKAYEYLVLKGDNSSFDSHEAAEEGIEEEIVI